MQRARPANSPTGDPILGTEPASPRRDPQAQAMRPGPAAAELAEAMREGLLTRRALGSVDVVRGLRTHARIHDLPPVAKPGALRRPMLLLRRIAHVLVRPWWAAQSNFNASVLTALEDVHRDLAALRSAQSTPLAFARPAPAPTPGAVSWRTLVEVFAHSRLPSASQRVLVVGDVSDVFARILQALGIDVTSLPARAIRASGNGAQFGALPLPTGSVDHLVDLRGESCDCIAEIARVLKPGGSLIGSIALEADSSGESMPEKDVAAWIRHRLAPLRCSEVVLAVESRGSWRIVVKGPGDPTAPSDGASPAMALFVAERP